MRIDNNSATVNASAQEAKKQSQMSVDDFLKIMAAEIQNQNPMGGESGGGSKTDYLTQLAQFTTLEQMTEINEGISQLSMLNQTTLIGKAVTIHGEGDDIQGVVDKVKFYNNQTYLQVAGVDYPLGLLTEVEQAKVVNPLEDILTDIKDALMTEPVEGDEL